MVLALPTGNLQACQNHVDLVFDRQTEFNADQFKNLVQRCSSEALNNLQDHVSNAADCYIRLSAGTCNRKIEAMKFKSFWLYVSGGGFLGAGSATAIDSVYLALALDMTRASLFVATVPTGATITAFCFGACLIAWWNANPYKLKQRIDEEAENDLWRIRCLKTEFVHQIEMAKQMIAIAAEHSRHLQTLGERNQVMSQRDGLALRLFRTNVSHNQLNLQHNVLNNRQRALQQQYNSLNQQYSVTVSNLQVANANIAGLQDAIRENTLEMEASLASFRLVTSAISNVVKREQQSTLSAVADLRAEMEARFTAMISAMSSNPTEIPVPNLLRNNQHIQLSNPNGDFQPILQEDFIHVHDPDQLEPPVNQQQLPDATNYRPDPQNAAANYHLARAEQ